MAVLRLANGGRQNRFLARFASIKFRNRTTFAHHADAITDPQNLGQIAGNNEHRDFFVSSKVIE